jgi:hypothetical protein
VTIMFSSLGLVRNIQGIDPNIIGAGANDLFGMSRKGSGFSQPTEHTYVRKGFRKFTVRMSRISVPLQTDFAFQYRTLNRTKYGFCLKKTQIRSTRIMRRPLFRLARIALRYIPTHVRSTDPNTKPEAACKVQT